MTSERYSLDDKRNKLEGYGDLQDIVVEFKALNFFSEYNPLTSQG